MSQLRRATARGKRLLMEAALRLLARNRSFQALGLRELAREAGLNPNTFYRHFKTLDDLGLALIESIAEQLRKPLRERRREAAMSADDERPRSPNELGFDLGRGERVTHESVKSFFDFVLAHPEAFLVGVREFYGPSPVLRRALRETIHGFATDLADDIRDFDLLPNVDSDTVAQLSETVMQQLFLLSLDYIESKDQREAIQRQAEREVLMLFTGAIVLSRQAPEYVVD